MRFRGFTYALRPTDEQAEKFSQFAGVCRLVWNLALEQRRDHWRRYQAITGNNLNFVTQSRELTALRAEVGFIRDVPQEAAQRVLKDLDTAFQRAWRGLAGFPRNKKKGVNDAFSFQGRYVSVRQINRRWAMVRIPKIGWVRFRQTRPIGGMIREASIVRTALGWQISFGCMVEGDVPDNGETVGIDRGVAVPIMLSDGTAYSLPEKLAAIDKAARKAQRIASRRKRGSRRHAIAQRRVARLRVRQARIRKDWAHRCTTDITRRYGGVVVERLRTKNMTASAAGTIEAPGKGVAQKRGLNRAILNVGWHQIEAMLAYKAARFIKVDPAYSSQTCASCGTVDKKSRKSQSVFSCTACGHRDNADRNAAAVILNRGSTPGVEPVHGAGCEAHTLQAA